ncbi:hypothetical protein GCM10010515_07530 [Streptomyces fructofermentans]|uniref:Helix-turn-helix domain-containing protein n=1 Tax=Streptomyces fructofermentans TaxID=152141 RepID=A0A918K252_9ACTN|nr:hypothetical protein GCM10010515_07530 [Streptomyces fructofermentans]
MPPEPIAASTNRQPRKQQEGAPPSVARRTVSVQDDNRSSLLADAWYSTSDLAARLHVDASTLRRWRTARPPQGPPFVSISERVVLYSALDVAEWLRSRRTVPGREA